jgi:hypothetical protein
MKKNLELMLIPDGQCPSFKIGIKSKVFWVIFFIVVFSSCGDLLINVNYKTYVS